jgi:hypothetical protein
MQKLRVASNLTPHKWVEKTAQAKLEIFSLDDSSSHENMMVPISLYPRAISITRRDENAHPFRGGEREIF